MKKILVILTLLAFSVTMFAQTGTGWAQNRRKENFKDSTNFEKGLTVEETLAFENGTTIINTNEDNLTITEGNVLFSDTIGSSASRVDKIYATDIDITNTVEGVALADSTGNDEGNYMTRENYHNDYTHLNDLIIHQDR